MYQKLNAVAPMLKELNATLAAPDAAQQVRVIIAALEDTAREVSDATQVAQTPEDRAALQKVYRGMLAAKRIVAQLHELSPV